MTLKERVEDNAAIWLLGSLLTGFLSGIAAYKAIEEMAGRESISKEEHQNLQQRATAFENLQLKTNECEVRAGQLQQALGKQTAPKIIAPVSRVLVDDRKGSVNSPSPQHLFPELEGKRVRLFFSSKSASTALEIQSQLEKYGAKVVYSEHDPQDNDANVIVYYGTNEDLPAATACVRALHTYGFRETKLQYMSGYPWDLLIHIRPD